MCIALSLHVVMISKGGSFKLRSEALGSDLHLHPFEGVVWSVPAVPSDAICALGVHSIAIEHAVQIRVCAAVVPVTTCKKKC